MSGHVLLLEPDRRLADVYRRWLEHDDYTVATACHAQDAVLLADQHCPDVVVLEMQLVQHNGLEFLYEFRSYPEWQHIPVVVCTVVPPSILQLAAAMQQMLGIQAVLYKPATTLVQLRRAVRAAAQQMVS